MEQHALLIDCHFIWLSPLPVKLRFYKECTFLCNSVATTSCQLETHQ